MKTIINFSAFARSNSLLAIATKVATGVGILALSAQAKFYLGPVPHTLQTYALFVLAFAFGARLGAATVLSYLLLGCAGAPFFAAGPAALVGPTGGYLLGYLPAAVILGAAASSRSFWKFFGAGIAATAVIYACGLAQLALFVPAGDVFALGAAPFVLTDLLKATAAALTIAPAKRFFDRF